MMEVALCLCSKGFGVGSFFLYIYIYITSCRSGMVSDKQYEFVPPVGPGHFVGSRGDALVPCKRRSPHNRPGLPSAFFVLGFFRAFCAPKCAMWCRDELFKTWHWPAESAEILGVIIKYC